MRRLVASVLTVLMMAATGATALERSLIPIARPALENQKPARKVLLPVFGPSADTPRPRPRPRVAVASAVPAPVPVAQGGAGLSRSPHPRLRPPTSPVVRTASVQSQPSVVTSGNVGKICGDKAIRGRKIAPIPAKLSGCGVSSPVEVTMVDGVALSRPSAMDCDTAKSLKTWVATGVKPTVGRLGGGVKSLQVAAGYSCRTRNNQPGAKISEHGKGKAIDISAVNLKNGSSISVLKDWNKGAEGKMLKKMHAKACGPFGTVLGPNADKYHRDHFHLDTASYRSGPYCR